MSYLYSLFVGDLSLFCFVCLVAKKIYRDGFLVVLVYFLQKKHMNIVLRIDR